MRVQACFLGRFNFTSDYLVFSMDLRGDTGVGRCVTRGRRIRRSRFRTAGGRLTRDGMNGVRDLNSAAGRGDGVAALFEAVVTHAGTMQLADDATGNVVRW